MSDVTFVSVLRRPSGRACPENPRGPGSRKEKTRRRAGLGSEGVGGGGQRGHDRGAVLCNPQLADLIAGFL